MWSGVHVIPQLAEASNYQSWEEEKKSQFSGDVLCLMSRMSRMVLGATMGAGEGTGERVLVSPDQCYC